MPSPANLESPKQPLIKEGERTKSRITEPKQLLVEGKDQKNFFEKFIRHFRLPNIQVHDFGGVTDLQIYLPEFVDISGFRASAVRPGVRSLGIVRDAEQNAASAFQSVQSALQKAGLPVPDDPGKRNPGPPAVTAYILPGGGQSGMLETLLCHTFDADPVRKCIDDFFSCVDALPGSQPAPRRDKARAHAYLTTMAEPHVSVGVAAQKDYWPLNHQAFADLRNFLKSL